MLACCHRGPLQMGPMGPNLVWDIFWKLLRQLSVFESHMKPLSLPPLLTWCVDNFVHLITQLKWQRSLIGYQSSCLFLFSYYHGKQNHIIEILISVWSASNDIIIYFQRSVAWGVSLPVPLQTGPQLSPSLQCTTNSRRFSIYRCAMNR